MTDEKPVLAAYEWPTNAELIADVARLGYLDGHILDPTFEKGIWWKLFRPVELTTLHRAEDGTDFRHLDVADGTFDGAAYDPPYVCPGGRETSTIKEMHDRFGMNERDEREDPEFSTPAELQEIINDGATEMVRVVKRSTARDPHYVLVKCKDYVWSGNVWAGTNKTFDHFVSLGCVFQDRFEHIGKVGGPQPKGRTHKHVACKGAGCDDCDNGREATTQQHASRNLSTLFVFRTPRPDKKSRTPQLPILEAQ